MIKVIIAMLVIQRTYLIVCFEQKLSPWTSWIKYYSQHINDLLSVKCRFISYFCLWKQKNVSQDECKIRVSMEMKEYCDWARFIAKL